MKKRLFALLLTVCMVVSMLPVMPVSAEGPAVLEAGVEINTGEWPDGEARTYSFTPETSGVYYLHLANNVQMEYTVTQNGEAVDTTPTAGLGNGVTMNLEAGLTYVMTLSNTEGWFGGTGLEIIPYVTANSVSLPAGFQPAYYVGAADRYIQLKANPEGTVDGIESVTVTRDGQEVTDWGQFYPNTLAMTFSFQKAGLHCFEIKLLNSREININVEVKDFYELNTVESTVVSLAPREITYVTFIPEEAGEYVVFIPKDDGETSTHAGFYEDGDYWTRIEAVENDTWQSEGWLLDLEAKTYIMEMANPKNEAVEFGVNLLPAQPASELTLDCEWPEKIYVGTQLRGELTPVSPAEVMSDDISWESSDTNVIGGTKNGNVIWMQFNSTGTATITGTDNVNGCSWSREITVLPPEDVGGGDVGGGGDQSGVIVTFDGYHGDDFGGKFFVMFADGMSRPTYFWNTEDCTPGLTMDEALPFYVEADPVWENEYTDAFTFEGWLKYEEQGDPFNGPISPVLLSEDLLTTAQLRQEIVPEHNVRYVAKWAEIDMEYYYNLYDPYAPDLEMPNNFKISYSQGASYDVIFNKGTDYEWTSEDCMGGYEFQVTQGASLADQDVAISDVRYWTEREFVGWEVYNEEFIQDEWGGYYTDVLREDIGILSTEELNSFQIPDDKIYIFRMLWAGDNSDYMAEIQFDPRGYDLEVFEGENSWYTGGWGEAIKKDGTTIGEQIPYITNVVAHGSEDLGRFDGWLICEIDAEWNCWMVSTQVYSFEELMAMVPEQDMFFIPQWSKVPPYEYAERFGVMMPFMDGVEDPVVELELDTPYRLTGGKQNVFTFTAPADGTYAVCSDASQGVDTEFPVFIRDFGEYYLWAMQSANLTLKKGQTITMKTSQLVECEIWVEKVNGVVKLEVISQDTAAQYIDSDDYFESMVTLEDIKVKATFEDGATAILTGWDFWRTAQDQWKLPVNIWRVDAEKPGYATVRLSCCDAFVTYNVKLMEKKPVQLEMIQAENLMDYYEGVFGWYGSSQNGEIFWYSAPELEALMATYRVTWDDGSVEEFRPELNAEINNFYGLTLWQEDNQWQTPWGVGTHECYVYIGELYDTFTVTIQENPVESISMELGVTEYVLGDPEYFVGAAEGPWQMAAFEEAGMEFTVNYKDGTSKVLTAADLDENGFGLELLMLDGQFLDVYIEPDFIMGEGEPEIIFDYMNCTTGVPITVVSKTVAAGGKVTVAVEDVAEAVTNKDTSGAVNLDLTAKADQEETNTVKLPVGTLGQMAAEEVSQITVKMDTATVTLDAAAIAGIAEQTEDLGMVLSVETLEEDALTEEQAAVLEEKEVALVLSATVDSLVGSVTKLGGKATISIPYTPAQGEDTSAIAVWFLSDSGLMEKMPTTYANGVLTFTTTHFSDYVVLKNSLADKAFTDVVPGAFYVNAVNWAVANGITTGKTATTFAPTAACTRAQVVTFLWRAAGCPEPQSANNPFPDVADGKYFTKAVLWAAEQGITGGYKDGTFRPDNTCTRDQIVTFLWRYMGEPAPASLNYTFPDVNPAGFYFEAVLWAAEQGITGGFKDGSFGPAKTCTRDQIVTFLYRALAHK